MLLAFRCDLPGRRFTVGNSSSKLIVETELNGVCAVDNHQRLIVGLFSSY